MNILVTGASSGIGQAVSELLSSEGYSVLMVGRDHARMLETGSMMTGPFASYCYDLTVESEVLDLVMDLPEIHGVVHCAGVFNSTSHKFINSSIVSDIMEINFVAPVLLTSSMLSYRKLADGASIVFISSISALHPSTGSTIYGASKAAVEAYSRSLAMELAHRGIRSNVIRPAAVATPMSEGWNKQDTYSKTYPMGIGKPVDVAHAVAFLLSDRARWISGAEINLGGVKL